MVMESANMDVGVDHRRKRGSRGLAKARCVRRHMAHGMGKLKARKACGVKARR